MANNTFNVSNFLSELKSNGILQTNKFKVDIIDNNSSLMQAMNLRAEDVNLPGISLDIQSIRRYGIGPVQKMASGVNFPDVSISFIDDSVNTIWKYLSIWFNTIFQYTGNSNKPLYALEYKENYVKDIFIHVYGNDGTEVTTVKLKEAFPISLSDTSLSWSNKDSFFKTTATFTYTEWEEEAIANNMPAPGTPISSSPIISVPASYYGAFSYDITQSIQTPPDQMTDAGQANYINDQIGRAHV